MEALGAEDRAPVRLGGTVDALNDEFRGRFLFGVLAPHRGYPTPIRVNNVEVAWA